MPYKRIEIEGDEARSQQLFREIVTTIPVEPYSMQLALAFAEAVEEVKVAGDLSRDFRRDRLSSLLDTGYRIVSGRLMFHSSMKASGIDIATHLTGHSKATLMIAKIDESRLDKSIGKWWTNLEVAFQPASPDQL